MKETELFEPVKEWLEERGYAVYPEVVLGGYGGSKRADVVALNGQVTAVVELKTSLSLDLLEQAYEWLGHAHLIYIAVPEPKKALNRFALKVLRMFGIGVLTVRFSRHHAYVVEHGRAKFHRKVMPYLRESVTEYHKDQDLAGGTSGGGYITKYSITMRKVKAFMQAEGDWVDINKILHHCETHYSAPKSSLSKSLRDFEHGWCECKKEQRKLWFRYKEENHESETGESRTAADQHAH